MNDNPNDKRSVYQGERWLGGVLIPIVLLALTVADFVNDGQISRELIAADIILVFGLTGRMLDLQLWQNFKNRGGPNDRN